MTGLREDMDLFERRALELETEQRHRFEASGSSSDFWDNRYEHMQSFLIQRYRKISNTYYEVHISERINYANQRVNAS